ncbi:hypothetical protein [Amycolatopsis pigmentata]|uniref:Uncharacterized protein n=1 Tax=Amycolatopsis pigmentata TaxID=450801 RepID=A0ABW5FMU9_9PSEU
MTAESDRIELVEVVAPGDAEFPKRLGDWAAGDWIRFVLGHVQGTKDHFASVPHLRGLCPYPAEELRLDVGHGTVRRARHKVVAESGGSFPEAVEFGGAGDPNRVMERVGHGQQRHMLAEGDNACLLVGTGQFTEHQLAGDDRFQAIHARILVCPVGSVGRQGAEVDRRFVRHRVGLGPQQDAYTVALLLADPAALVGPTADTSFGYRLADAA